MKKTLILNSPSRIHLGFIQLDKSSSRIFGSLGLTISSFNNNIVIKESKKFNIESESLEISRKVTKILKLISQKKKIKPVDINIKNFIPTHQGFGSGTQLSLSVGFLISKLNKLGMSEDDFAILLNRGKRSGIGIESFKNGGFIIDLGKQKNSNSLPLKFFRMTWPQDWKIILLIDNGEKLRTFGKKETKKFSKIIEVSSKFVEENSKAVLMNIIPGILEKNFTQFAEGIQIIQSNMSKIFYGKSNLFASLNIAKIFQHLKKIGIIGFGQSSWGPTGFVFCKNSKERNRLYNEIENYIKLNNIRKISLIRTEGRNKGKTLKTKRS